MIVETKEPAKAIAWLKEHGFPNAKVIAG